MDLTSQVVTATGTLALGIHMPCKTVVLAGDSPYLNSLQYRQASTQRIWWLFKCPQRFSTFWLNNLFNLVFSVSSCTIFRCPAELDAEVLTQLVTWCFLEFLTVKFNGSSQLISRGLLGTSPSTLRLYCAYCCWRQREITRKMRLLRSAKFKVLFRFLLCISVTNIGKPWDNEFYTKDCTLCRTSPQNCGHHSFMHDLWWLYYL